MKISAVENHVLQGDRVLQGRVLEGDYSHTPYYVLRAPYYADPHITRFFHPDFL